METFSNLQKSARDSGGSANVWKKNYVNMAFPPPVWFDLCVCIFADLAKPGAALQTCL